MSTRHTLPMVAFTVFYIPPGIKIMIPWFEKMFSKKDFLVSIRNFKISFWFLVLFAVGSGICIPKLLRPLHFDKLHFLKTSQWLEENTKETDFIAASDPRICFYANRKVHKFNGKDVPVNAKYIVRRFRSSKQKLIEKESRKENIVFSIKGLREIIFVYKIME